MIIARTDALAVDGYEAALERVSRAENRFCLSRNWADVKLVAARDCGADMGFLEAIETEEQIKNAVKVLAPMPVSCLPKAGGAGGREGEGGADARR